MLVTRARVYSTVKFPCHVQYISVTPWNRYLFKGLSVGAGAYKASSIINNLKLFHKMRLPGQFNHAFSDGLPLLVSSN